MNLPNDKETTSQTLTKALFRVIIYMSYRDNQVMEEDKVTRIFSMRGNNLFLRLRCRFWNALAFFHLRHGYLLNSDMCKILAVQNTVSSLGADCRWMSPG
jgi:hypothetical protein